MVLHVGLLGECTATEGAREVPHLHVDLTHMALQIGRVRERFLADVARKVLQAQKDGMSTPRSPLQYTAAMEVDQ